MAITYNTTIDQGADWFINFIYNQPALITNVVGDGTTVTFTANNGFEEGQTVGITGVLPNQYNFASAVVSGANPDEFFVENPATGVYISGGMAYAPVNITGDSAELQLRSLPNDSTAVLTLSTENNGISITGLSGLIEVHATAAQTRAIDEGYYYYDLELTQAVSGIVTRIAQGQILVSAEITR